MSRETMMCRRWENGYIEPFNGKAWDELLNGKIFTALFEAQVLIENWRDDYGTDQTS